MPAYFIFIRERTTNQAEFDTYTREVPATTQGHHFTALATYGRQEVVEGPPAEGVFIASFPSMAEAKAWYDSPEYTRVRQHRFRGAEYRAILVEGVE